VKGDRALKPQEKTSGISREALISRYGDDPTLEMMILHNDPLTRERYLMYAYPGRDLEKQPLEAEEEAMLPEPFRQS